MTVMTEQRERWALPAILGVAVVVRVVVAAVLPSQDQLLTDAGAYRESAAALLANGAMSSTAQMPLYPLLIALTGPGWGQLAADILLSVVTVWLIFELTREVFADRRPAIFAGIAAACYPPLIFFAVVGLSETLFIALMLAAFLSWYRGYFMLAALFAVLAVLTRPVFDLAAPALVVAFALFVHRMSLAQAAWKLAAYAVVYVALMTPWWVHNYRAYGTFVRLNPNLGTVLYAGNNPLNQTGGGNQGVDYDVGAFGQIAGPVARDRALFKAAVEFITENPGQFATLAVLKFSRLWRPWPAHEGYSNLPTILISAMSFIPVVLLAALGLMYERRHLLRLSPILLFAAGYTALHMILVGTIRYRLPLEPFLLILAGVAMTHLFRHAQAPREAPKRILARSGSLGVKRS